MIEKADDVKASEILATIRPTYIKMISNFLLPDTRMLQVLPSDSHYPSFHVEVEEVESCPYGPLPIPLIGPSDTGIKPIQLLTTPVPGPGQIRKSIWVFQDKSSLNNKIKCYFGEKFVYQKAKDLDFGAEGGVYRHFMFTPRLEHLDDIVVSSYDAV
ncbi:hypothetical protein GEA64_08035 [Photorhabdus khanii]|uniref:Uncharacterized protein n=1 Tax=Photorhabdus khanii TaxID=1004150 RepID=A0A7C9GIZ5_9GAMM|nr:hypothetical protein [Photorhabdus khanii]MQL47934.1 hypothetical protein [Photorhabdus khanii]